MTTYDNDMISIERDREELAKLVFPVLIKDVVEYEDATNYILGLDSVRVRSALEEKLTREKSQRYQLIDVNHDLQPPCGEGREPWPFKTPQHTLAIERLALPITRRSLLQKLCFLPLFLLVLYFSFILARILPTQ